MDFEKEVKEFIEGVSQDKDIYGVVQYGSTVMKKPRLTPSDVDLLVCVKSSDFSTPENIYEVIAECITDNIRPVIKTMMEFVSPNSITMAPRYKQHLINVGKVVYDGSDGYPFSMEELLRGNPRVSEGRELVAYMLSPALAIRHTVLNLHRGKFEGIIKNGVVKRPAMYLWQNAIDLFGWDISPEQEDNIVGLFYDFIKDGNADQVYSVLRELDKLNGSSDGVEEEVKRLYFKFKEIVEDGIFALDSCLNYAALEKLF